MQRASLRRALGALLILSISGPGGRAFLGNASPGTDDVAVMEASGQAAPARQPGGALRVELGGAELPRNYRPVPGGAVLLLDAAHHQVVEVEGGKVTAARTLRGGDFDPSRAELVDVLPGAPGELMVLDAGAGTIWIVEEDGNVRDRFGIFVHPTRFEVSPRGDLAIRDPGVDGVVIFESEGDGQAILRKGPGLTPFATTRGTTLALDLPEDESAAILYSDAQDPERSLRFWIAPAPGLRLLDAWVVGEHDDIVSVLVQSYRGGSAEPEVLEVVQLDLALPPDEPPRRIPVTLPGGDCMDCGPAFRVGPDGALWMRDQSHDAYRLFALDTIGGLR